MRSAQLAELEIKDLKSRLRDTETIAAEALDLPLLPATQERVEKRTKLCQRLVKLTHPELNHGY